MSRKLSLLFATVGVVVFAAPGPANAAPQVTVGGKPAPLGTRLTGVSLNTVITSSIGDNTCKEIDFETELTANSGSTVTAAGIGTGSTSTCFFKGSIPITIDDATLLSLHSASAGGGTIGLTFVATLPNTLTCHYVGSAIPFTYSSGSALLFIKGGVKATPPACGTAAIDGAYTITSPAGTVVLH